MQQKRPGRTVQTNGTVLDAGPVKSLPATSYGSRPTLRLVDPEDSPIDAEADVPIPTSRELSIASACCAAIDFQPMVAMLSTLSNEVRLEILSVLATEKHVNEIADELELDHATVSHALRRLLTANLVQFEVQGRKRLYRLSSHVRTLVTASGVGIQISMETMAVTLDVPLR